MRLGLFGLPGAGKGTQAERIAKYLSVPHVSTGEMFREMQTGTSELAKEIRAILSSGQLVPDEVVTKMAFVRLGEQDCAQGFVLDGFPRTLGQAEALQDSAHALDVLISLDVAQQEIIRRLARRRICGQCKSVFSVDSLSLDMRCPNDGALVVQRDDDREEAVAKRLSVYEQNAAPVVRFFQKLGLLKHVDGSGSESDVFGRLIRAVTS